MFLFILNSFRPTGFISDSNTSHVLIYHKANFRQCVAVGFKYISCSYLSQFFFNSFRGLSFKYISCSYLSMAVNMENMLNAIFKYISCSYLSSVSDGEVELVTNSNTSHVLIYPIIQSNSEFGDIFKYISCSYLSYQSVHRKHCDNPIQIHLMFLFIRDATRLFSFLVLNSNTSHVLIYPAYFRYFFFLII